MTVLLDRENIEKTIAEFVRRCRTEFVRQEGVTTALDIAHERARECLQNSLPARPGAF
jgi:hypothetical protein